MIGVRQTRFLGLLLCGFCVLVAAKKGDKLDKFRLVLTNVSSANAEEETAKFLNYGCEALIVITNEARDKIRLGCKSAHDTARAASISPGHSYLVSIRPLADGTSEYWCTLLYQQIWSRFDAYSENRHAYLCPGRRVYKYIVRHDGVYADPERDEGVKIRALHKGHNAFTLWESYDEDSPDGQLMHGFVDGGMCSDLPDHFDDRTVAVTVCDHQCLLVYDNRRCTGPVQKIQAGEGCQGILLDTSLIKKVSAIKGC